MIFRQLFDPVSSTYTYLLADRATGEAVLIDPVFEQARRDAALIRELGLALTWTLETHVHADHVTAAWLLKQRLGSRIALAAAAAAEGADRGLAPGDRIHFGARHLEVRATPGHTDGCLSFVLDDATAAFTGDCLLVRGCGRTDFQQGDPATLYRSVQRQLFTLPGDCLLYPAHDYNGLTATSVAEERACNPRLGGRIAEADFVGYMNHLGLPHPKQMARAVPANLRCGRPEGGDADPWAQQPGWAQLVYTFAGLWEIHAGALAEVKSSVQVLDVREPAEFNGALGHIEGALLIPLGALPGRCDELDSARPVVVVCRSGARSARAVAMLAKAGFSQTANLSGGMLRWRAEGQPVVSGQE
jgi:glyoxylase-like metal-dependent hydrolase (beta-lactamase superfamily II)/rhodanese-related sulfurtransferase